MRRIFLVLFLLLCALPLAAQTGRWVKTDYANQIPKPRPPGDPCSFVYATGDGSISFTYTCRDSVGKITARKCNLSWALSGYPPVLIPGETLKVESWLTNTSSDGGGCTGMINLGKGTGIVFLQAPNSFVVTKKGEVVIPSKGTDPDGRLSILFEVSGGNWDYFVSRTWYYRWEEGPAPPPSTRNFSGPWNTSFGTVTFRQNGSSMTGSYTTDNGKIEGTLKNSVLDGVWIEDKSGVRCNTPASDGRYFWGRLRFTFDPTGKKFTGLWSYCDGAVTAGRPWNGTKQ